ncbi:hypothetical protein [Phycicoccus sp. Soil802]|uniref:WD40 repeat domain-containing protein n=1 Tax=Phycicoccus sp. Soil802 TaxID=1736414 RepID=UPI0009EAF1B3
MSAAPYDRPLYAVPAPPSTKARFAFLLALRRKFARAPRSPGGLAFSPDGQLVAAGLLDGHIRLWQTSTWTELSGRVGAHHGQIYSVAFGPDSGSLVTAASDDVIIWDLTNRSPAGTHLNTRPNGQ